MDEIKSIEQAGPSERCNYHLLDPRHLWRQDGDQDHAANMV